MVYDCCTTLPPSRLLDLITFCPGRTEATVHWSSGAEPILLTMTLKPWACSEFTVSCTDPPLRWGGYSRRRQCQCCGCYSGCGEGCDGELHHLKPLFMLSDVPTKAECLVRAAKPKSMP